MKPKPNPDPKPKPRRHRVVPAFRGANRYGECLVLCPACGDDYVHHTSTTIVRQGHDAYQAEPGHVRGDVIYLPMWCENGHHFCLCFGFHKGQTKLWLLEKPWRRPKKTL